MLVVPRDVNSRMHVAECRTLSNLFMNGEALPLTMQLTYVPTKVSILRHMILNGQIVHWTR